MAKIKSMTIKEFMNYDSEKEKALRKVKVKKAVIATTTIVVTATSIYFTGFDHALAATSIDKSANIIYGKLLLVGKWIIIIKGAIDTINNTVQGDFNSAKKSFLSYLIIYLILNAFPWAMDQVDTMFKGGV